MKSRRLYIIRENLDARFEFGTNFSFKMTFWTKKYETCPPKTPKPHEQNIIQLINVWRQHLFLFFTQKCLRSLIRCKDGLIWNELTYLRTIWECFIMCINLFLGDEKTIKACASLYWSVCELRPKYANCLWKRWCCWDQLNTRTGPLSSIDRPVCVQQARRRRAGAQNDRDKK